MFEIRGLTKSFGELAVLVDLNLSIPVGKTTVIIGPSGCGKTVLLKHLIVLLRPDSGVVFFDEKRIDNMPESQLLQVRKRFGFLFQAGALFDSQTVGQNVAFALLEHTDHSMEKINELVHEKLEMVGLAHLKDRFPAQLSGGQQKRIALARAIAFSPEVILYDEPTTGLDPIRADIINELILKMQSKLKVTSVVVTHDMASAYKIADRIIMLDKGHIIADGSVEDIREHSSSLVQNFIQGVSIGLDGNY
ncbi:MAG: ABC transporter ATP-binding protein [Phycisphaerae bacterium]|nr:ABC transporter ATP-binding protein [Phycisphaerae bacterium]